MSNLPATLHDTSAIKLASFAVGVLAGLFGAFALIRKIVS